ncbi:uncharacterized protein JN550_012815 [Neoarthrinium moseri]|uniref:uncharacterized protein n=1 Tax=Neoarthrinium moseri TaxID=1658444 RepID=UPI001FDD46C5|nr:uncharacterized protein JN550_012815 [Neoarthrinium moseri]KAI1858284.1 hypothetical protein JN550_012815 [Neoarthrinium moseri]
MNRPQQNRRAQPAQQQGMSTTRARPNTNLSVPNNHQTAPGNIQPAVPSISINQPMRAGQSGLSILPDLTEDEELDPAPQTSSNRYMPDWINSRPVFNGFQVNPQQREQTLILSYWPEITDRKHCSAKRVATNMAQGFRQQSNDMETWVTDLKDGLEQYASTQNQENFMDLLGEDQFHQE